MQKGQHQAVRSKGSWSSPRAVTKRVAGFMHNHWRRIEQLGGSYWFYLSFISYESRGSRPKYPAEIPGPGPVTTALKYSKKAKGRDRTHIFNLHIWIKHVPYLQTWCWTDYRRINSWLEVFKCWKRQINFSCCSFSFFKGAVSRNPSEFKRGKLLPNWVKH